VYQAVALQLKAERAGKEDLFACLGSLAGEVLQTNAAPQALEAFRQLASQKVASTALQALEAGSAKPGCRYDVDYAKGAGIVVAHVASVRGLTRILCAAARVQAADGDSVAAWNSALAALRMANALKNEPLLISQLTRMAQFRVVVDTIHAVSVHARPAADQYAQLDELLKTFDDSAPLVRTMDGERLLFGEWAFNLSRAELRESGMPLHAALTILFAPRHHLDHAVYLKILHAAATSAGQPYATADNVQEETMMAAVPRYCVLTRTIVPALANAKMSLVSMRAQARITRAGLAVLRYRQEKGAYPATPAVTSQENLIDPFSGKALIYHLDPTGFTIYSVGRNMIDDGGVAERQRNADDIAWQYAEGVDAAP